MNPKVSIVMTSYNYEKFIGQQIQSILNQTYKNWELIIADDCSTDNSLQILGEFEKAESRILVIEGAENVGVSKNFGRGLSLASGELIAVCDSDDYWLPEKLAMQVDFFKENPELVLAHHDGLICDENLCETGGTLSERLGGRIIKNDLVSILKSNSASGSSIMFKKSLINKLLPMPSKIFQDHWISLVAAASGKVGYIDKPLFKYRQHSSNTLGATVLGPAYYIKNFWSDEFQKHYLVTLTDYRSVLECLSSRFDDGSKEYELISAKIECLKSLQHLLESENVGETLNNTASSYKVIHQSGYYYHLVHLVYFLLYKLNPAKFK